MSDIIAWEASLPIRPSSPAWRVTLKALYSLPMSEPEQAMYTALSGREEPPAHVDELMCVVGRRGGKSETIGRVAMFEGLFGGHEHVLAPGQVGLVMVISPLREQSQEILGYARGLAQLPEIAPMVRTVTRDTIELHSGITIKVTTADALNVSGPTVVLAILDEGAKLPGDDAAVPDRELVASLRPALAPLRGAPSRRLIVISSAYLTEGWLYEQDRDNYGRDGDVLVVRGTTAQFNPNIDLDWLERERRRVGDRVFAREYLGEWQDAVVDGWFGEVVAGCVDPRRSTPLADYLAGGARDPRFPVNPTIRYYAGIDAGWRADSYVLAICHRENAKRPEPNRFEKASNQRIIEHPPPVTVVDGVWVATAPRGKVLDVSGTVRRTARIIREYGATTWADQHDFDSLSALFEVESIRLRKAPWTGTGADSKATRFRRVRDAMTEGLVRLPNEREIVREFENVQGRLLRSGIEQIEARTGHDDRVAAVVLAISEAMRHEPDRRRPHAAPRRDPIILPFGAGDPCHILPPPEGELPSVDEINYLAANGLLPKLL